MTAARCLLSEHAHTVVVIAANDDALAAWNAVRMDDAADIAMKRKALIWRYRAVVWPLYLVAVLASIWLNSEGLLVAALVVGCGALIGCRAYVIRRYGPAEWAVKMKAKRDGSL